VAYSTAFSQAISILLVVHAKMEELRYEFVSAKVIAECLQIPAPTVVKILKSLNSAGITTTKEGVKGGVLLAKPITGITLLDLFMAIEHGTPLFRTQLDYFVENQQVDHIKSKITNCLKDAEKAMKDSLKNTTLADLY
jgi:Rrf2 family protein